MRGDLAETAATDVCRHLAAERSTGSLVIDGPDGPGSVWFVSGRIAAAGAPSPSTRITARLLGRGQLEAATLARVRDGDDRPAADSDLVVRLLERGLVDPRAVRELAQEQVFDALLEITGWRYGTFGFTPDATGRVGDVGLSLDVDEALAEVTRRRREWDDIRPVIPDLDTVPEPRRGARPTDLDAEQREVLAEVDGERSVAQLATELGFGRFGLLSVIHRLDRLGLVDLRVPQDEVGAALEDALGLAMPTPGPTTEAAARDDARDAATTSDPGAAHGEATAEPGEATAEPGEADGTEAPVTVPADAEGPTTDHDDTDAPATDDTSNEDADVSELLRELSRLADDDEPRPRQPRTPTEPPAGEERPDRARRERPRRRGRFGRGS